MTILVTGMSGFLGEHLARHLVAAGEAVLGLSRGGASPIPGVRALAVDVRDARALAEVVGEVRPDAVVHAAAMTDVAACELDPALAMAVNASGTAAVVGALAARAPGTRLVHISTDLVFDGESAPYAEGATVRPLSAYGRSKVAAEAAALAHPGAIVLRAALLYGPPARARGSFLSWMVSTLRAGGELAVFEDELRTPLEVGDAARAIHAAARRRGVTGAAPLLHLGGPERLSRLAMALVTARAFGLDASRVRPTRLAESTYAAPRPRDVSLDSRRLWSSLGGPAPLDFAAGARLAALAER